MHVGSQQLGTQSEQAMAVPKSLRNNKKKETKAAPLQGGSGLTAAPSPPNPFFLPPSPTGCRRSFTYDRWDEDLDATEGAERSSRSPTSDGETESRAAETPA